MNGLKRFWKGHGTKLLGALVVLIGAAGDSLSLIQAVDPKHAALWALVTGVGGFIIKRGFTNSAAPLPPPDPNASRP
jgi:hypothetical protein